MATVDTFTITNNTHNGFLGTYTYAGPKRFNNNYADILLGRGISSVFSPIAFTLFRSRGYTYFSNVIIPAGQQIDSATLTLVCSTNAGTGTGAYSFVRAMGWDAQTPSVPPVDGGGNLYSPPWDTAVGNQPIGYHPPYITGRAANTRPGTGTYNFDVTDIVTNLYAKYNYTSPGKPIFFMLALSPNDNSANNVNVAGTPYDFIRFDSSFTANKPKLVVNYSAGGGGGGGGPLVINPAAKIAVNPGAKVIVN